MPADRELRLSRTYEAPAELIFRAFLDGEQLTRWWAPAGIEIPPESVDVEPRVGGHINYAMVDPETGRAYPVLFEIVELVEDERLVLQSPPAPELGIPAAIRTVISFEQDGESTRVTVTQGPHTEAMEPDARAGWASVLENLDALVA